MGTQVLDCLRRQAPAATFVDAAIRRVCDLAMARKVRLLVDAEEQAVQPGIDNWCLRYQQYCNSRTPGRATFYTTYQAYLRSTPATIARHLEVASQEGYTLGVKLVRGAYLKTEPRHLIWAEKEETDRCYDGVVDALLKRRYNEMLKPSDGMAHSGDKMPSVDVIVATHNRESVQKAHALRVQQAERGESHGVELSYAQLQGMADEISGELLQNSQQQQQQSFESKKPQENPNVYKLLTWGSVKECMGFLLRRAVENTEAVARTKQSQQAMMTEMKRRTQKALGLRS